MALHIEGEIPTALSGTDLADLLRGAVDRVEGTGGATGEPESVQALRALADLVARGRVTEPPRWGDEGLDAPAHLELEDDAGPPCPDCGAPDGDDHRDDCFEGG